MARNNHGLILNSLTTCLALFAMLALYLLIVAPPQAAAAQDAGAAEQGEPSPEQIIHYIKKDTREASWTATIAQYMPAGLEFGPWYLVGPFANAGSGELDRVYPPETQPFNPKDTFTGKNGITVKWQKTNFQDNGAMNLRIFGPNAADSTFNEDVACYLYREIRVKEPTTLKVQMGSDDGMKVWCNGKVVVHADELRGWSADQNKVTLDLEPGVNTILAKVINHQVDYTYSFGYQDPLTGLQDAMLEYLLNLDFPRSPEDQYYRMVTFPLPDDVVMEVGGMDMMPDGRIAAATRHGDVWIVENAYEVPPLHAKYIRFASGLHEPLGLACHDGAIYCTQRPEVTRMVDMDHDDHADVFETFCDYWGVSGNYHEFGFGPKFDQQGNLWVTLNLGFCGSLGKSIVPWRGWCLKISPDGKTVTPICGGLRSPNGIGMNAQGDMFYCDNQGDWVGTCKLSLLGKGDFQGHPGSERWYNQPNSPSQNPGTPAAGPNGPIPMHEASKKMPTLRLPAVWFPYGRMGQSSSDIQCDLTGGKFGPFENQLFIGDQTTSSICRVYLEKVNGEYQGACFPFRSGFDCGVERMCWGKDGSLFVGETNRGWGSLGRKPYGLQRLVWTGKVPFEVREMHAEPNGFRLVFTRPVDAKVAANPAIYKTKSFTYLYHEPYGSPEVMTKPLNVTNAEVSGDHLSVMLTIDGLREGFVHEINMDDLTDADGEKILHGEADYTLNHIPGAPIASAAGVGTGR